MSDCDVTGQWVVLERLSETASALSYDVRLEIFRFSQAWNKDFANLVQCKCRNGVPSGFHVRRHNLRYVGIPGEATKLLGSFFPGNYGSYVNRCQSFACTRSNTCGVSAFTSRASEMRQKRPRVCDRHG